MENKILLSHGSGGKLSQKLVREVFVDELHNEFLDKLDDYAAFTVKGKIAFTTDSYVINPIFFPGGDIGKLAVCGTVNDVSMSGARPLYLSLGMIIEEGLSIEDLKRIVKSVRMTAEEAGVKIVAGDTKVVHKGKADQLFINTTGIGEIPDGVNISGNNAQPGDAVIVSGTIGDHGIAVISRREGLEFGTELESDCAPLNRLVEKMLGICPQIHCMRDPTRGGLAVTLNELAGQSGVGIHLRQKDIPVREEVEAACEMLGFDPLYVANEGKLVAFCPSQYADKIVETMRRTRYGENAAVIGEVVSRGPGKVVLETSIGGSRIVDMLVGDMLPRIC